VVAYVAPRAFLTLLLTIVGALVLLPPWVVAAIALPLAMVIVVRVEEKKPRSRIRTRKSDEMRRHRTLTGAPLIL
jgi:hypothetical protein